MRESGQTRKGGDTVPETQDSPMLPTPLTGLKDTQSERDFRRIPIDRVGVKNLRYPMQIRDKAQAMQHTIAKVMLTVDLPHEHKGTHMSRFVEVLNEFGPVLHVDNIAQLLLDLSKRLHSESAHARLRVSLFPQKEGARHGAAGMMDYTVRFSATTRGEGSISSSR